MEEAPPVKRGGCFLTGIIVVLVGLVLVAAIAIPVLFSTGRVANERGASTSPKVLITMEYDFKANDRDGNGVNDFWTGDVAGLACMASASTPGNEDSPLKLIDVSIAGADSAPLAEGAAGGEYPPISGITTRGPKYGHWYFALNSDLGVGEAYRQDTGGTPTMGKVHNTSRFGFMIYPDAISRMNKWVFLVNEGNTLYRREIPDLIKPSASIPPGPVTAPGFADWPKEADLKADWKAMD